MSEVTVVGSYIVALVMDVRRIPLEGETLVGENYHTTHGGKGSNMAVCAARLGANTAFMGKIGRDSFGEKFLTLLVEEGVDAASVLFAERNPTAVGFILFSAHGSNVIVIDPAANADFLPGDVFAHSTVVSDAAVSLSPLEIPLPTALAAARIAREAGKKFILNPAPAIDLRGADLSDVFALTPNEREARVCLGLPPDDTTPDEDLAVRLRALGVENVIITRGALGVWWAGPDGGQAVPAPMVDVVDTVGAGDAFNAGLAVGLAEGQATLDAIRLGVTAASLSTRYRETIASYPFRPEVNAHLNKA